MTLPVITSVILILYCLMTPLMSLVGGGDQDMLIELELTEDSPTFCGEVLGAEQKQEL